MSQSLNQESFLKKKRNALLLLPAPRFKKAKLTFEEDTTDIIPIPHQKEKLQEVNHINNHKHDQNNYLVLNTSPDSISLSSPPPIKFIYHKRELNCKFKCHYNFSGRTVFIISQIKPIEEIQKLKLSCNELEHCVKLISLGDSEDMSIFDDVCIIENPMNDVYIIFHNENQFDWGSYSTCENEYLMYKVINTEKMFLMTNKQYVPIVAIEPLLPFHSNNIFSSNEDNVAVSLFDITISYSKLSALKIEVPMEKKRFEDRLSIQAAKYQQVQQTVNNTNSKAEIEKLNKNIVDSEVKLQNTSLLYNQDQINYNQMTQKIESQDDIFDKLTRAVMEEQKLLENDLKMKEEMILQQEDVRSRIDDLDEDINKMNEEKYSIKNKITYETINGKVFEEIGKEDNSNKDLERKLLQLENQYETSLCSLCMLNQRDCLFPKCKHLFCCSICVNSEINKNNNKNKKKKLKEVSSNKLGMHIKGKIACPYCNESISKFLILALR